jgi:hypothetical protein
MSYNWWIDQENLVYIHNGVYSVIRNNDMWFEGKWMQLENIMLSEVNQALKEDWNLFSHESGDLEVQDQGANSSGCLARAAIFF